MLAPGQGNTSGIVTNTEYWLWKDRLGVTVVKLGTLLNKPQWGWD